MKLNIHKIEKQY